MRIVVTGASGQLGAYVLDRLQTSEHEVVGWSRTRPEQRGRFPIEPVDLASPETVIAALKRADPDAILHLAAISRVDAALADPAMAMTINAEATGVLADWAAQAGRRLVAASTDLVFDGSRAWSREDDPAEPILTYGQTKRAGELRVLRHDRHVVARLGLLFGPSRCGRPTFLDGIFDALRQGERRSLFLDEFRTPLDYATAAEVLVLLLEAPNVSGIVHVGGAERVSRFEMLSRLARHAGLPIDLIVGNRQQDATFPEPRPVDVSLDTSRLVEIFPNLDRPTLEGGLDRCGAAPC